MTVQCSEYEKLREQNIKERLLLFQDFFKDINEIKHELQDSAPTKNKRVSRPYRKRGGDENERSWSSKHFCLRDYSPPRTRARSNSICSDSSSRLSSPSGSPSKIMVVKFPFNRQCTVIGEEDEEVEIFLDERDYSTTKRQHGTRRHYSVVRASDRVILPPEDVTDRALKLVAESVKQKVYDPFKGTTCHQCRQKTNDTKTVCRAEECIGVRGQFCGPCLRNRYGEDAREALKDPDWACPVCRNICNCSFCRERKGRNCTGIMVHFAKNMGFDNVKDYLEVTDK